MKKCIAVFALNSSTQNEFLAWHCLEHGNIEKFKQMLKEKMPLTAYMMNAMLYFGCSEETIRDVLKTTEIVEPDIFPWMKEIFKVEELADILPEYDDLLPNNYPSDEDCIKLKLWKTLLRRKKYQTLAVHAPEILEEDNTYEARRALISADTAKYAEKFIKENRLRTVIAVKDGWKYLVDRGHTSYVLRNISGVPNSLKEVLNYCLEKGLEQELYDAGFVDFLIKHEKFEILRKNHCISQNFLHRHPAQVDWEGSWKIYSSLTREILLKAAREHKDLPICREFLKNHGTWWERHWL